MYHGSCRPDSAWLPRCSPSASLSSTAWWAVPFVATIPSLSGLQDSPSRSVTVPPARRIIWTPATVYHGSATPRPTVASRLPRATSASVDWDDPTRLNWSNFWTTRSSSPANALRWSVYRRVGANDCRLCGLVGLGDDVDRTGLLPRCQIGPEVLHRHPAAERGGRFRNCSSLVHRCSVALAVVGEPFE